MNGYSREDFALAILKIKECHEQDRICGISQEGIEGPVLAALRLAASQAGEPAKADRRAEILCEIAAEQGFYTATRIAAWLLAQAKHGTLAISLEQAARQIANGDYLPTLQQQPAEEREGWRPISTAPKDYETIVDLVLLNVATGQCWRVPNCRRVYGQRNTVPDTWAENIFGGKVVHGRRYYDEDGDECFEWGNVPGAQNVVTHWMLPPPLPTLQQQEGGHP